MIRLLAVRNFLVGCAILCSMVKMVKQTIKKRFFFLDAIRGVAAIAVCIGHYFHQFKVHIFGPETVDTFFCLSGFVIAHAYQQELSEGLSVWNFLRRRLVRLYPMYLVGFVLGGMALNWLILRQKSQYEPNDLMYIYTLGLFYIPYFNTKDGCILFPLNAPAWSLSFEMLANLVYAQKIRAGRHSLISILSVSLCFLVLFALGMGSEAGWATFNWIAGFPRTFYSFFMGVLIFNWSSKAPRKVLRNSGVELGLLIAFIIIFIEPWCHKSGLFFAVSVAVLIPCLILVSVNVEPASGPRVERFYEYLGWISYPLYCLHFPLLKLAAVFDFWIDLRRWSVGVIFITFTFIFCHVVAKYFDEPVRKFLAK